jgi:putative membrane protein insertion efficiency factor
MSLLARALLFSLRVYQSFFSALMPSACKFYPSCSHYAAEAVQIHGARRGSWLALRRVLRCHPFTRGGVDLVPDAADFREAESGAGFSLWGFGLARNQNPKAEACATEAVADRSDYSVREARS